MLMSNELRGRLFRIFNEIGIIEQLSRTLFEAKMPHGLLVSHFSVVNHLIRVRDGRTPLELARAFQVPKTTMTYTLTGLEKNRLIKLCANPADGRSKLVWLTDEGRKFREDAIEAIGPELDKIAPILAGADLEHLIKALTDLRQELDDRRSAGP